MTKTFCNRCQKETPGLLGGPREIRTFSVFDPTGGVWDVKVSIMQGLTLVAVRETHLCDACAEAILKLSHGVLFPPNPPAG